MCLSVPVSTYDDIRPGVDFVASCPVANMWGKRSLRCWMERSEGMKLVSFKKSRTLSQSLASGHVTSMAK